jgi:transcriptional regulator with XRE-family HTH domain
MSTGISSSDIVGQWSLSFANIDFINSKPAATRLGLASQLKFFSARGFFADDGTLIPNDAVEYLAEQIGVRAVELSSCRAVELSSGISYNCEIGCGILLVYVKEFYADFRIIFTIRADFRMKNTVFQLLGEQLLAARKKRDLSQPALAERVGRDRARISELERDLANNRLGRDRLTLFAELCDTLDLVPVLIPKLRMESMRLLVDDIPAPRHSTEVPRAFDELFIDLDDDETKEG